MKRLILASLLLSACASPDPIRLAARRECDDWLGRHNLMQRPGRGTRAYAQLIDICVRKHTGIEGEIDNALAR